MILTEELADGLPRYEWDSVIRRWDMASQIGTSFVREIRVIDDLIPLIKKRGLLKVLELCDTEFTSYATYCDSLVVGHTWGVTEIPDHALTQASGLRSTKPLDLVAEVDRIEPIESADMPARLAVIAAGGEVYQTTQGRFKNKDLGPDQFMYGIHCQSLITANWFTDIDASISRLNNLRTKMVHKAS